MRRYHLKKKKIKEIRNNLALNLWVDGTFEMLEKELKVILVNGVPSFFFYEGKYYPTVLLLLQNPIEYNYLTVDMGAVKHVLNGANVFAAGIVEADPSIKEGDAVYVRDIKYRKALAVGIALMSGNDMVNLKKGMAVKNIHYYGDKISKILD